MVKANQNKQKTKQTTKQTPKTIRRVRDKIKKRQPTVRLSREQQRLLLRQQQQQRQQQQDMGSYVFKGRAASTTGPSRGIQEAKEQQLAQQVAHPSEAGLRIMRDDSLLQHPNLLALIYFEFRCTLFKQGDTIKLFNKDASQWNTCTLASNSFQGNVVNRPECKGGPKYIESKYDVQFPVTPTTTVKEGGKFIKLLQNLYPFESCYSSDRGKVTFINEINNSPIPANLDFFVTDQQTARKALLQPARALLQRWEEWCNRSAQGRGSAVTNMNGTALTSDDWNRIKNWGLQEVMHANDSSIPTDVTPSGPSAALYYPLGREHTSSNLEVDMSGLTQPGGGNTRLTPRAPAIIWLYNNSDIGQEILGYFDTGNGMEIYDMTGSKINQNQISSHGKNHFSKNGIESQLYKQLYILISKQPRCGGAAITAIEGLRISSTIGTDGGLVFNSSNFEMNPTAESIVPRGKERVLDPVLQFTEEDERSRDQLLSQQSYFGAFNLPNAQYTISPGIWIIVDIPRMPHSILVILKGGKKFTIGAGYRDAPETGNPFGSGSTVPLLIYSPDTSIYSADEARPRPQQNDHRLDYEMTKHQHIRKIGEYNEAIQSRLQAIIGGAEKISQGGSTEFMTTFVMKQNEFGVYKTLPVTRGTMNCTSLTLWITNQRNITGVCAPGGIYAQIRGAQGDSGPAAAGPMQDYFPQGGRRKRTKRRRKRKTKRKRHGKKRVKKTRGKKKRRGNRKRRTRR